MDTNEKYQITLTDFTLSFVPFGLLLGAALLAAEATMDLGFYRTVYTIWATAALVAPALCAFVLPGNSQRKQNIWILFWTFSFIVYLVHMGYAIFSVYHGSMKEFLAGQGVFAAINNVIFTAWWALDVYLAWFRNSNVRWIRIQRIAAHWYIGLTFFASTVILKHGFINVIGSAMAAALLVCFLIRFDAKRRAPIAMAKAQSR
jgi:hypothetical protein